ncbi:unnamed protein product [Spodoptera littoralis]|uniref:HTH CENPB-type domain-containing protein n=1 Tax=Spodoptera littoralis TaxID=7109 RepID=A0A9P0HXT0_SPOLI|nr:unnamed protein product [Spodoptera littoralis]CAH1636479.1 unnamed protein product [Spodoptera littoralis]
MVRNYKKKKENDVNEEDAERAVLCVINDRMKLRTAAAIYNIKPTTLYYRVKKYKENVMPKNINYSSKHTVHQVFTNDEELMLERYFLKMSKMNYGLTYLQGRKLAYQYAAALDKCPEKWLDNKSAGIEWMKNFMKRHPVLSLRKPENTSLSRSTSFNKHNVMMFFDNYERVLQRGNYTPDCIYNLDETSIMTVVQAPNVIARTGQKQVGQSVSAERARFHETMLIGAPVGSVGFANSPTSGWMTGPLFLKVLQHIKKTTRCTKENKILILLDNHESHCTIDAINFARENGIELLTFPPHCTHKLQPLDVAVNSPFKAKLAVAQNDWLLNHPGKTITIHDLASIVTPAYNASHTINNITSGFSAPGIYPFSRNKFTDDDFECSEVTNRADPSQVSLIVASENLVIGGVIAEDVETDQPQQVLSQFGASIPHNVNDNVTQAEDLEINELTIAAAPDATDNAQIVAPAPSTIDSDATDADIEVDQPVIASIKAIDKSNKPTISLISQLPPELNHETDKSAKTPTKNTNKAHEQTPSHSPSVIESAANIDNLAKINRNTENIREKVTVTPEAIRPFPKAIPRTGRKGRKKGSSRILTDTPEKCAVEAAYLDRMKRKPSILPLSKRGKCMPKNKTYKKKKPLPKYQSNSESDGNISFHDDSDMDLTDGQSNSESNYLVDERESIQSLTNESLNENDYILVKCHSAKKESQTYFVAFIKRKDQNMFLVSF